MYEKLINKIVQNRISKYVLLQVEYNETDEYDCSKLKKMHFYIWFHIQNYLHSKIGLYSMHYVENTILRTCLVIVRKNVKIQVSMLSYTRSTTTFNSFNPDILSS